MYLFFSAFRLAPKLYIGEHSVLVKEYRNSASSSGLGEGSLTRIPMSGFFEFVSSYGEAQRNVSQAARIVGPRQWESDTEQQKAEKKQEKQRKDTHEDRCSYVPRIMKVLSIILQI